MSYKAYIMAWITIILVLVLFVVALIHDSKQVTAQWEAKKQHCTVLEVSPNNEKMLCGEVIHYKHTPSHL